MRKGESLVDDSDLCSETQLRESLVGEGKTKFVPYYSLVFWVCLLLCFFLSNVIFLYFHFYSALSVYQLIAFFSICCCSKVQTSISHPHFQLLFLHTVPLQYNTPFYPLPSNFPVIYVYLQNTCQKYLHFLLQWVIIYINIYYNWETHAIKYTKTLVVGLYFCTGSVFLQ